MQIRTVKPSELYDRIKSGEALDLIDVRTPAEFSDTHVGVARCVPLHTLDMARLMADHPTSTDPLYVICQSGARGQEACRKLVAAGYDNVVNVEGGISAWTAAGLPVDRGRRVVPLDGQVRIAIGSIVLASALLSLFHPYFLAITIFMGAGLIFSGISGFCGLAMLLARAPWNQSDVSVATCEQPRMAS
jgi:rhodanese-related sulfurtransferase